VKMIFAIDARDSRQ